MANSSGKVTLLGIKLGPGELSRLKGWLTKAKAWEAIALAKKANADKVIGQFSQSSLGGSGRAAEVGLKVTFSASDDGAICLTRIIRTEKDKETSLISLGNSGPGFFLEALNSVPAVVARAKRPGKASKPAEDPFK